MTDYKDFPLPEIAEAMDKLIKDGWTCHQKWTCDGCGRRLMGGANVLTTSGRCDDCGHVTDIAKKGCNYLKMKAAQTPADFESIIKDMGGE